MSLYFFSYARGDDDDEHLDQFFEELVKEVRSLKGVASSEGLSFRDTTSIRLAQHWPQRLAQELQTAKAMVCLYSPTYFTRPDCGKEWTVFRDRVAAHAQRQGVSPPPPLLIPVRWIPPNELPAAAKRIQWTNKSFGKEYDELGLKQLKRLSRYKDEYTIAVNQIAKAIVDATQATDLPALPSPPDYDRALNAFGSSPAAGEPAVPPMKGPRHAKFILVAGKRAELSTFRQQVDAYGETSKEWIPFLPECSDSVGILTQTAAVQEKLTSSFEEADDGLVAKIEQATVDNNLVVLIIDPWTLRVPDYQQRVGQYDGRNFAHCAALHVRNNQDPEQPLGVTLEELIQNALFNRLSMKDPALYGPAQSDNELITELRRLLLAVQSRVISQNDVKRRVESGQLIPKPSISASLEAVPASPSTGVAP